MAHELDGARAKLERADENISNLEREIVAFLREGKYAVLPDDDAAAFEQAAEAHQNRVVPLRFSVLGGEIVHHLRSCLDHIAWQLSSEPKRASDPAGIEFPIFGRKPADKSGIKRYERKVEGISGPGRKIIEALQPYHRDPRFALSGPRSHPLWIIHEMDAIDKHRELILTQSGFEVSARGPAWAHSMLYRDADLPEAEIARLNRSLDPDNQIAAQVAFREFGGRKIQPVIKGLSQLADYVRWVLALFADECF